MTDQLPPHDPNAERAVLSSLMLKPDLACEWPSWLRAEDFFDPRHRDVAEAIRVVDAAGSVDVVTVANAMRDAGKLERAGGMPYLAELTDATPAVSHVWEHARIVADAARVRAVQGLCQTIRAEGYGDVGDVSAWLQGVEARVYQAAARSEHEETVTTFAEAIPAEQVAMAARANATEPSGITTGLRDLDRKIGRLKRSVPYVIAGRPGMGKTGLALQMTIAAATSGQAAIFVSLEMPREQLIQRAIAQFAGLDTKRIEAGNLTHQDWRDVVGAVEVLGALPIAVDDAGTQTIAGIRSSVRRGLARLRRRGMDHQLGCVAVDYIQKITPTQTRGRSRENEVTEVSDGLRALAKEFACPVLVVSQLNRDLEKRPNKRPQLSDLRESGAIEQDAYGIFFVYRDEYYHPDSPDAGVAEIGVAKLRQGGSTGIVRAAFHAASVKFSDLAQAPDGYEDDFNDGRY